ncbi:MAG: helix-turn-helix domain-containing protein [Kiritimatiellae bacterium]|nr:helix-turn-helix domain-containing protein [Kiritimatiellia bacterium]
MISLAEVELRIARGGRPLCDRPGWRWQNPADYSREFDLWFVVQGKGTITTPERVYPLFPGACFLLRMWEPSVAESDPGDPILVPWVCFDCLDVKGRNLAPGRLRLPPRFRQIADMSFLDTLIQRTVRAHNEGESARAAHWLRAALLEVERHDRAAFSGVALQQATMIDGLCKRIEEDPGAFRSVAGLAEQSGYSKDHFIRLFRTYRKVTPGEYVIRARIQSARNLLAFSGQSVTEVAEQLGYPDLYSFCKQFKARTGLTPSEFRRKR